MKKVLFICHGNICRSPMAEYVMQHMVEERHVAHKYHIESAATSREEIGNPVHPGTRRILDGLGISCKGKRAVQTTRQDYNHYDYIIGMDSWNMRNMSKIYGGDPDNKLYKLLEFAGSSNDVADPWYTGNFEVTYRDVKAGCEGLLNRIMENM